MKKLLVIGGILAWVALAWAASTGRRISDVLHVSVFHPSDLLVAARTNSTPETNVFTTWAELSNSIAGNVSSKVYTSNSVWLSKTGNDSTGVRGEFTHPFLTPLAAANAGQPGDTVFVLPGTYGVKSVLFDIATTLLRTNLNWHFFSGAKLTNDTDSPYAIFDDNQNSFPDGIGSVYITGEGEFVDDYAGSAVRVSLPGTRLDMQFRKMSQHVNVSAGTLTLRNGILEGANVADNAVFSVQNASSTSILDHVYLHYTNNDASGRTIYIRNGNTNTILRDCVLDAGPTATKSVVPVSTGVITVYGLVSMNVTNDPAVTFLSGLYQPPLGSTVDTNIVGNTNISGILASNDVRVAAGANVTVTTNGSGGQMIYTVAASSAFTSLLVQTGGVSVGFVTNINYSTGLTGSISGQTATLGSSASGGGLTGTTNFIQLSVQAGKPPVPLTNFPGIDPGWRMWEGLYYKTNAEGSIADIGQTWDFSIPNDYATNSLTIHGWYFLESTNGPNTSNTIFRASILRAAPGDSTDIHTAAFGSTLTATNTWTASGTGTNKIQQFRIAMSTSSLVQPDDIATLKLERVGTSDTFGGVVGLSRLRIEYTRR